MEPRLRSIQEVLDIPHLPRSWNYLVDCEDDRLDQEQLEDLIDMAELYMEDR